MSWKEFFGALGPVLGSVAGTVQQLMTQTMEEAQERVRETTKTVIKATTVFVIIIIGVIYVLNGLGAYLEYVNTWPPGLGPIVVGIVLVILGWFASLMRQ
jgi:cytochrome bd-type quinol oxidase subunit 2